MMAKNLYQLVAERCLPPVDSPSRPALLASEPGQASWNHPHPQRREEEGGEEGKAQALPLPLEHIPSDVGQFLPELASELATAQTTQDEEMEDKEERLRQLQEEIKRARAESKSARVHISAVNRSITLAQDSALEASVDCHRLEENITKQISEGEALKRELEEVEEERGREEKRWKERRRKMVKHRERVVQVEGESKAGVELAELEEKISQLRERRSHYMCGEGLEILNGGRRKSLLHHMSEDEEIRTILVREMTQIEQQVTNTKQNKQKLQKDLDMTRKRHQAQLTRLHRQLQEAQLRRRQWSKESSSLKEAITQLRQKVSAE